MSFKFNPIEKIASETTDLNLRDGSKGREEEKQRLCISNSVVSPGAGTMEPWSQWSGWGQFLGLGGFFQVPPAHQGTRSPLHGQPWPEPTKHPRFCSWSSEMARGWHRHCATCWKFRKRIWNSLAETSSFPNLLIILNTSHFVVLNKLHRFIKDKLGGSHNENKT